MKIIVTQDHIDRGTRGTCGLCPIALAVQEATGCHSISVGNELCQINGYIYRLPPEAQDFIVNFDCDRKVNPFEFELE